MTATTPRRRLRGDERLKAARDLKARYDGGASIRQLVTETGRAAGTVRKLLDLAGAKMRPSGGGSKAGRKPAPRVIVKRVTFREPTPAAPPTGPLNKTGLAEAVAADLGIPLTDGYRVLDAVFGTVTRTVTAGHDVTVTNFGTWRALVHPARVARNPQNGQPVKVPERSAVRFRVSPRLQEVVRGGDPAASIKKRPKSK
jgi:nucleoid DNA-binding protein